MWNRRRGGWRELRAAPSFGGRTGALTAEGSVVRVHRFALLSTKVVHEECSVKRRGGEQGVFPEDRKSVVRERVS